MKGLDKGNSEEIFEEVREIIQNKEPGVIDQHVDEFPLSADKRRWYDKEPYSWMIVNAMKFVRDDTLERVNRHLKDRLD